MGDVLEAVGGEELAEAGDDGAGDAGAFIDHAAVHLNEGGAGGDFFPCVRGGEDAADADDGKLAAGLAVEVADDFGAALAQGATAEAAGFCVDAAEFGVVGDGAGDGGVGGDDAGQVARCGEGEDFVEGFEGEVGGDFDEDGFWPVGRGDGAGGFGVGLLDGGEDVVEGGFVLELAEVGGVGGADVDDEEIGKAPEEAEGAGVVFGGFLERGDFGFAEVDADGMVRPAVEGAPFG